MLERFLDFIKTKQLFETDNTILVAVSGGIDSMCMMHLLYNAGIKIGVAHCNFGLRGEESDIDEQLVKKVADQYQIPFYSKRFNTLEYAKLEKLSIQVAARQLRYSWFENLRRLHNFSSVAIAHNADDAIETFFINLLRGTGIQGIGGIKVKNHQIIRPLLFAYRSEIEQYVNENNIEYRTDSSNLTDKYLRNKIRLKLMPALKEIKPDYQSILTQNLERFSEAANIYQQHIDENIPQLLKLSENGIFSISIEELKINQSSEAILFEILKKFNATPALSKEIYSLLESETGRMFFTDTHRILRDRNNLLITELKEETETKLYIDKEFSSIDTPISLKFETIEKSDSFEITKDKSIAILDADKLTFPLLLRKWQHGDYFRPLGMNGFKKVSDFFIDSKISIAEKENTWILASADDIVWIIGMRIDDRFKISSETKNVFKVSLNA